MNISHSSVWPYLFQFSRFGESTVHRSLIFSTPFPGPVFHRPVVWMCGCGLAGHQVLLRRSTSDVCVFTHAAPCRAGRRKSVFFCKQRKSGLMKMLLRNRSFPDESEQQKVSVPVIQLYEFRQGACSSCRPEGDLGGTGDWKPAQSNAGESRGSPSREFGSQLVGRRRTETQTRVTWSLSGAQDGARFQFPLPLLPTHTSPVSPQVWTSFTVIFEKLHSNNNLKEMVDVNLVGECIGPSKCSVWGQSEVRAAH